MKYEIGELDVGGVLDHALALCTNRFKFFFATLMLIEFPSLLVVLLLGEWSNSRMGWSSNLSGFALSPPPLEPYQGLGLMAIIWLISLIHQLFLMPIAHTMILHGMSAEYLGHFAELRASFRFAIRIWPRFVLQVLLILFASSIGYCLCIVPGILIMLVWYIADCILILENARIINSLERSYRLMKGEMLKALSLLMILGVIQMFFVGFQFVPVPIVSSLISAIGLAMFTGFQAVASMVFYFSVRCRKENLDLELAVNAICEGLISEERTL